MIRVFPRKFLRLSLILGLLFCAVVVTVFATTSGVHAATRTTVGGNSNLSAFVGYAEDKETNNPNPANFPVPWAGAPNTTFLGNTVPGQTACGALPLCYDTGAIRFDNSGTSSIVVSNVTVNVHGDMTGGKIFSLWGSFTVAAGKSVILAANPPANNPGYDNFDTSGYPSNNCTPIAEAPTVTVTIAGVATVLADSTHVLDTGGIDRGYCKPKRNESIQWRAIGAPGADTATLSLSPTNANPAVGQSITETALLLDGSGLPTPNALVNFTIPSGPDSGKTANVYTNSAGHAAFTYTNTSSGQDTVVASITTVGTFHVQTNVTWGQITPTPTPPPATWTGVDIGSPSIAGSQSLSNGVWTVSGEGVDIGGISDQFHFVWEPLYGDGGIRAQVLSQSNTNSRAQAGVMLRLSTSPGSPFYEVIVTPQRGIYVFDRSTQGANVSTVASITTGVPPIYLQVLRSGTSFTAYTSSNGTTWTSIAGSTVSLSNLTGTLMGGMAVCSKTSSAPKLDTATFNSVSIP